MATYIITESESDDWDDAAPKYKYRHRSSSGQPTAQAEFDRRIANGESVYLWSWQKGVPTLIQQSRHR